MARKKFRGLTEVAGLSDEQALDLVLGNWHKLNAVLMTRPPLVSLQRLLALELSKRKAARPNVVERLRSAVSTQRSRDAREAAKDLLYAARKGLPYPVRTLHLVGLDEPWIDKALRL